MAENSKMKIRKQCISARNQLEMADLLRLSANIADKLNQLGHVRKACNIMCFVSFGSEVSTHDLIKSWLEEGKKVCVPVVAKATGSEKHMVAIQIRDFNELCLGYYGILEPPLSKLNIVNPEEIDVVIVPGSAFDTKRNRIGYGGGFYDIFLKEVSHKCKKIGICFDLQVQPDLPVEEFDIPVDILITEKRIIV